MSVHEMRSEGIEQLLRAETEFHAPASLVAQARLKDYAEEYRRSVEDGEAFWAGVARELEWFEPWQSGLYAHPRIGELIAVLRSTGLVRGAGQSSWGPAVFAVVRAAQAAAPGHPFLAAVLAHVLQAPVLALTHDPRSADAFA